MSADRATDATLRLSRLETSRLAWAFAVSLALHLAIWGTYAAGQKWHWWEKLRWPAWVQKITQSLAKSPDTLQPADREPPLVFIEVSPASAVTEPPKDAPFYSDKNAVAANPDLDKESEVPKITGTQEHVPKTEDTPRKKFDQLMPAPPQLQEQPQEEARAKPKLSPGDLTLAKADPNPRPDTGTGEKSRPKTIKEALLRQNPNLIPGQKVKQDGGAQRRPNTSYNVKATGFGAYDRAFIDAVASRWYDLLDNMSYDGYRSGRVVLQFNLNYDGRITEMKVLENTVTDTLALLCQKAVLDPAPFDRWPREMRLLVGEDSRKITFTFYYN